MASFPQFTALPPELQAQIWEECTPSPAMHIFDVCLPSWRGPARSRKAFENSKSTKQADTYKDTIFLDVLDTSSEELRRPTRVAKHAYDPSMYRLAQTLRSASHASHRVISPEKPADKRITIRLPGRSQTISLPQSDVLMLRFRHGGAATQAAAHLLFCRESTSTSEVRPCELSTGMAETLTDTTKLALDVTETSISWMNSAAAQQEIAHLASLVQQNLEVLYLVDNCAGRCKGCRRDGIAAEELENRDQLWESLHHREISDEHRVRDVIHAVSKRYVEVFDLERLGWTKAHPAYLFAKAISTAIRDQQDGGDQRRFQGARVLIMEDDDIQGIEAPVHVDCRTPGIVDSPVDILNECNLHGFSHFVSRDRLGVDAVQGRLFRMALSWDP